MKIQTALSASLLAMTLSCPAEEPNPFVKQEPKPAPPAATGDSFVSLTEHILVPADQLDAWLEKHPLTGDAAGLRAMAQTWIAEGTARLDHTALSSGTAGRLYRNESIWEQSYATEYEPTEPGEWPVPTSFATMNLGYDVSGHGGIEEDAMVFRARMGYSGMMAPQRTWNDLAERTKQPDDIFIPRFRSIKVEGKIRDAAGNPVGADPFAEPSAAPAGPIDLRFDQGKVYLASRADEELPEPTVSERPDSGAKPAPLGPNHRVRLIFFRGDSEAIPAVPTAGKLDIHHVSAKLIRVDHKTLSNWVQVNDLSKVPDLAWEAAAGWQKNGLAQTTVTLTAPYHYPSSWEVENRQEVIYPTEWEPGKRSPASEGKPSRQEFSGPSAFETRNVGATFLATIMSSPEGPLLKFALKRVTDGGKSVHHRIFRDDEWKADITFPIFTSNRWESEIRAKAGQWMLVGSGSDIDAKGKLDPDHAVLAFIRLD